jgi:hypothetical protein
MPPTIETRAKSQNGVGTFAVRDIKKGTVILRECPFVADLQRIMIHFHTDPAPTGDPAIDEEIRSLKREVESAIHSRQCDVSRMAETMANGGGVVVDDRRPPPRARAALDKLNELAVRHEFDSRPESIQEKWLSLHDAFRVIPSGSESPVGISGLVSPKGRRLNDTIGTSLGKTGTGKNSGRFSVRTARKDERGVVTMEDVWIKRENLTTVYGTCRSNSFLSGMLFERACRINHSCRPNAVLVPVEKLIRYLEHKFGDRVPPDVLLAPGKPNEHAVLSDRDIRSGEEITLNYLGSRDESRSTEARREILLQKYGFNCECEACERRECC